MIKTFSEYTRINKDKPIVFGPWAGELGWELPRWIPACRFLSKDHSGKKYAIGPRGHGFMYEFVDEYIQFDKDFTYDPCMFRIKPETSDVDKFEHYENLANKLGTAIHPVIVRANAEYRIIAKKYTGTMHDKIKELTGKPIICIFPRQRSHVPQRNWALNKWIQLVASLCNNDYAVMSFGGPEDKKLGYRHPQFFDFTEYNKDDQIDLCISALNLAKLGVAIQSGGFYLSLYSCEKSLMLGLKKYVKRVEANNITRSNYKFIEHDNLNFDPTHVLRHIVSYANLCSNGI